MGNSGSVGSIVPNYNVYNYCYNNPINATDPNGMLAKYNWETGKYEENGVEIDWRDVMQELTEKKMTVTYSFKAGSDKRTSPVIGQMNGNRENEFFYNGDRYVANSLYTPRGRDDSDNRIGALLDPNWLAEMGTKGRHDEPWEQRAISEGRAFARKFLKANETFQ